MPVPLPAEVNCYLSNTCTGIDCCVQVDKLGLAMNAYVKWVNDCCLMPTQFFSYIIARTS
jgi:hypothetical protein